MTVDDAALGTAQDTDATKRYTHGTHRVCPPEETLARLRPLTAQMGITRVANVTGLDREVFVSDALVARAAAFKLLVIWHPHRGRARRARLVAGFVDACRAAGRPSLVEGIVRRPPDVAPDGWDHAAAVVAAAQELGSFGPDVYKAEVPTHGTGDPTTIVDASRAITAALACPWVVLSNGVAPDRFDDAAAAACEGGASGFLAGRAIWTASLAAPDVDTHLREVAAPRLAALAARIDTIVAARHDPARTESVR